MNLLQKKTILIIWAFMLYSLNMNAQTMFPEGLRNAFVTGNSEKISTYFGRNVELMLLDKGDVYSKAQAQLIISNFFNSHIPQSFSIESESSDENTYYAVALLETRKNNFRIFIAYRGSKKKLFINQLIISEINEEQ